MIVVAYTLEEKIREAQKSCKEIHKILILIREEKPHNYKIDEQGTLWLKSQLCVPQDQQIWEAILSKGLEIQYCSFCD